jgi:hypothetical protein
VQFYDTSENDSGRLKRRTKECESMCYPRMMTTKQRVSVGVLRRQNEISIISMCKVRDMRDLPLRIRKRKTSVRSEGMGAEEIGGRDEMEVKVWVRGKQNKQKRLASKKNRYQVSCQKATWKNMQP